MLHQARRLTTVLLALAVVVPAQGTATAQAPAKRPDLPAASAGSAWQADQLDARGTYPNPFNPDVVDGGLMMDAVLSMHASGMPGLARPILRYFDDRGNASDYYTNAPFKFDCDGDGDNDEPNYYYGGKAAKTLLTALVSGRNPRRFGGRNVLAETRALISKRVGSRGKLEDRYVGESCQGTDAVNTFGQTLGVLAFAELDAPELADMTAALLLNQCEGGYFRLFYYPAAEDGAVHSCTEDTNEWMILPDGDSTGFALSGLLAARAAGVTGLDDHIDAAVDWLVENQDDATGGWAGGQFTPTPNTNSTGLIVQALAEAGAPGSAIRDGRRFISSVQVTPARDGGTRLGRNEMGAIAYSTDDYAAAQDAGAIGNLDTWIRASAQAVLGLTGVGFHGLAWGPLRARLGGATVRAGKKVTVVVPEARRHEVLTVRLDGRAIGRFTIRRDRRAMLRATVPARTKPGRHRVTVTGDVASRRGPTLEVRVR